MTSVREKAYAKINLYLNVLEKRDDGFHSIETVMHTLSLSDDVTVTVTGKGKRGVKIFLEGNKRLPVDSKNIAYAAAALFLEKACIDAEVTVKLVKRIPISAGLAGGSADAAAVLRGMNRLFGKPMSEKMLLSMAALLGSDVPFCLVGGTALCLGRGEQITRLPDRLKFHAVIAHATEHVSTPIAYSLLDDLYSNFDGSVSTDADGVRDEVLDGVNGGTLPKRLYNIFESAILPQCPGASAIKDRLVSLGATHAMMSGSGPSVFAIFEDEASARAAENALIKDGISAFYAKTV